jgi:GAF domain-containing protein
MTDTGRAPEHEIKRLRGRLERERLARREAELIAERTTRELYDQVATRTRELESLVAMGRELAKALDSRGLADVMATHIAKAVDFDECGIYSWDRLNDTVRTAGYHPADRRAALDDSYSLVEYPETARVLVAQLPSVTRPSDPTADPSEVRFLTELGGTLMAQLPIVVNGESIGTVELLSRSRATFDEWQLTLAQTMANEAGIMLENARLYGEIRHQALHDSLTGLPNRALLGDRLGHALASRR